MCRIEVACGLICLYDGRPTRFQVGVKGGVSTGLAGSAKWHVIDAYSMGSD